MPELIVATKNKGKLKEIRELLRGLDFQVTSLADYPDAPLIVEDGRTFRANAAKKALTIARWSKKLTLGEDSGLQVRALDNRPGVYSSRFAGDQATDKKNNAKLLRLLRGIPLNERQARYRCVAVLADGKGIVDVLSGSCPGLIAERSRGSNGFGYDPLFLLPRYQQTFGQLDPHIKARISHRAKAMKKVRQTLQQYLVRIKP